MSSISLKFSSFINWWLAGLITLVPKFLRSALILEHNRINIDIDNEQVILKQYFPTSDEALDIKNFNINDTLEKDAALLWLRSKQQKPTKLIITIPEKLILIKTIQFPAAASNNLKEALGFEINKRTPFTTEQVYFDYSVINHDKDNNKLKIDLIIVPKNHVDSRLNISDKLGLKIDRIIPDGHSDKYANVNLLPTNKQTVVTGKNTFNFYLAATSFILFLAALYLPLNKQNQYIDELQGELQTARKSAVVLSKLKEEKQSILKQINFLTNKQLQTVNNINILNVVTKLVPDDTWLSRFSISNNQLQIQGESSNASALIQTLELSDLFKNVQFKSPVIRNNRTSKDKFNLSAELINNS